MMNKYELRCEVRAVDDSRLIEGKAISFETESNDLGFIETLKRGCITDETIAKSNIVFTYNHLRDKILARSKNGQGNLGLEIKDDGVYFRFNAPNTTLGNDVLEDIKCGNLSQCSFAFTLPEDADAQRWYKVDGVLHRDVYKIDQLWDCSVVVDPAYEDTYIAARNAEISEVEQRLAEEEARKIEESTVVEEEPKEADKPEETPVVEEPKEEVTETVEEPKEEPETVENTVIEEVPETDDKLNDERSLEEPKTDKKVNKNSNNIIMNKDFSLVKALRSVAFGEKMDAVTEAIMTEARGKMKAAGINFTGNLQLPIEGRDAKTITVGVSDEMAIEDVNEEGLVELNYQSILKPLQEKSVLTAAGAKILPAIKGDYVFNYMDEPMNAGWAGEIDEAIKTNPDFHNVVLRPLRIAAYYDISKLTLIQDSLGVENAVREGLIDAMTRKLEATIFDQTLETAKGTDVKPKSIFVNEGNTALKDATAITDYKSLANFEASFEEKNIYADMKYIVSPKAKAALRVMPYSSKTTQLVMEGNSVDGVPVLSTSYLKENNALYGDFSNVNICVWDGLDLVVDNITLAHKGMIRVIANMYVNYYVVRPEAIGFATITNNA